MLNLHAVPLAIPENANIILGQSHFIKTVDDLYEAMVNSAPGIKFGVAFNEASGPCLTRCDGTDAEMRQSALDMAAAVGAGHFFAIAMRDSFPINVLKSVQAAYEVCNIFCATANPVQVIVAETEQGRGVLGVIDGSSPKGVETEEDVEKRRGFLKMIGYKR
jgi:adenosine/AMP kinase